MNRSVPSTGPIRCVVGARPGFAPSLSAMRSRDDLPPAVLLHTGQHYEPRLKDQVFGDLCLPLRDIDLLVGSGAPAGQTADVMKRLTARCIARLGLRAKGGRPCRSRFC